MKYIDLSVTLNHQTPTYPGDPHPTITPVGSVETTGHLGHQLTCSTHSGTHIDAPQHMIAGGKTIDQYSVDHFIGRGILLTLNQQTNLAAVQQAGITEGDVVLFHTGMGARYHQPEYFTDFPVISREIAEYLVAQKVKMIGVDACSIDNQNDYPNHKILLGNDVLAIENLTGLERLAGKKFTVYALPIKLDVDAAPARVISEVLK